MTQITLMTADFLICVNLSNLRHLRAKKQKSMQIKIKSL